MPLPSHSPGSTGSSPLHPNMAVGNRKATGLSGKELVDAAAKESAGMMIAKITDESKALKNMVDRGKLKVIGGYYSLESGKVELWD